MACCAGRVANVGGESSPNAMGEAEGFFLASPGEG